MLRQPLTRALTLSSPARAAPLAARTFAGPPPPPEKFEVFIDDKPVMVVPGTTILQITYKADHTQLTYLQLMSAKASQNVTFHCRNTIGYYDARTKNYRKGIKLLAYNDAEILPKANNRLRYKALLDECQHLSSSWARTIVEYETDKPGRLPLLDVAIRDVGRPQQMFRVELGLACFT